MKSLWLSFIATLLISSATFANESTKAPATNDSGVSISDVAYFVCNFVLYAVVGMALHELAGPATDHNQ